MVGTDLVDDAAVYRLTSELAIVFTTDFFPPVCSDPFLFGRIAATNALSDVYAMGGKPIMALNLMMYPDASIMPPEGLAEIFRGGLDAVSEAGAVIAGGHTIRDDSVKYGLAVVGTVHPDKVLANSGACPGDALILTKPIGTGVLIAGYRLEMLPEKAYNKALDAMQTLNRYAAEVAANFPISAATDITGFGLLGHAMQLAEASDVLIELESTSLPILPGVNGLIADGCVPAGAARNLRYVSDKLENHAPEELLMAAADAQTSGGLLLAVPQEQADSLLQALRNTTQCADSSLIGIVSPFNPEGGKRVVLW